MTLPNDTKSKADDKDSNHATPNARRVESGCTSVLNGTKKSRFTGSRIDKLNPSFPIP